MDLLIFKQTDGVTAYEIVVVRDEGDVRFEEKNRSVIYYDVPERPLIDHSGQLNLHHLFYHFTGEAKIIIKAVLIAEKPEPMYVRKDRDKREFLALVYGK